MFRKLIILGTLQLTTLTSLVFLFAYYRAHSQHFHPWNLIRLIYLMLIHIFALISLCIAYTYE